MTAGAPPGFTITTRDAAGDAVDSDADPSSGASHVVSLATNATDESVDAGLVPASFSPLDYGDAPDPAYPTLLASDGARHRVLASNNPTLGAAVGWQSRHSSRALRDRNDGILNNLEFLTEGRWC